ncbi:hypothetical protein EDD96_5337 [Streptomyces sp. Ag109_G2-6]|uniref:hypothetical protein n=1 Tax=Streptomyces sp. Ag109_G2-6 TaxID=2485154 RepID=UPI000C2CCFD8|nr:hypothetical protein [Streptomyces sp. Ag109_G2-6]RPF41530.1 hypothetical protein EDD96_5337 [Streptomyces sp. Ag109_G2-6]
MSGARYARTVSARALTVACVALLCLFGAGPAAAATAGADPRAASSAPADPAEGQSDPAADPDGRADLRTVVRGAPAPRGLPGTFHVKHAGESTRVAQGGPAGAAVSPRTVRSVVLRC